MQDDEFDDFDGGSSRRLSQAAPAPAPAVDDPFSPDAHRGASQDFDDDDEDYFGAGDSDAQNPFGDNAVESNPFGGGGGGDVGKEQPNDSDVNPFGASKDDPPKGSSNRIQQPTATSETTATSDSRRQSHRQPHRQSQSGGLSTDLPSSASINDVRVFPISGRSLAVDIGGLCMNEVRYCMCAW